MNSSLSRCRDCNTPCYDKVSGELKPKPCYIQRYLKSAYQDLLIGPPPKKDVIKEILHTEFKSNSLIYFPHQVGKLKAAALCLMKMRVASFRMLHSHVLVEVFVSKSEDDLSLSTMYGSFFLILHGFIPTPNRRLMDLLQEFLEYRLVERVPFVIFSAKGPEQELIQFFESHGLPQYTIGSCLEGGTIF